MPVDQAVENPGGIFIAWIFFFFVRWVEKENVFGYITFCSL